MKRLAFLSLVALALAGQQHMQVIGFPSGGLSASTVALDAAASGGYSQDWLRVSYIPTASITVSKLRFRVSAVTGTLGANDLVCDIYSDSSGAPGSSLASSNTVTTTPAGAAWVEFTGFSQAVTAYTQYWIVLRNANAAPASNYPTYIILTTAPPNFPLGPLASVYSSSNSGSAWSAVSNSMMAMRVESDASAFYGFPLETQTAASTVPTNFRVHSARNSGVVFTTASNAGLNVRACGFTVTKGGTPTGNLSCVIYSGSSGTLTAVATSASAYAPSSWDATGRWTLFYFSSPVSLNPGAVYRVALVESAQSDTSSNYYAPNSWQVDSNANSLTLLPFAGTLRGSYCTSSCTTAANWTSDSTNIPAFGLLLDPSSPYAAAGGQKGFGFFQ